VATISRVSGGSCSGMSSTPPPIFDACERSMSVRRKERREGAARSTTTETTRRRLARPTALCPSPTHTTTSPDAHAPCRPFAVTSSTIDARARQRRRCHRSSSTANGA
jgi:hypothetical protein